MLINTQSLVSLGKGYNAAFKEGFSMATPQVDQVATTVPSGTAANLYPFLGQFPEFKEWAGDRQIKDMKANGYLLPNKDFEATVAVKATTIKDDSYGMYAPMMQQMGYSARMHPDKIVFAALAAGASSLCYDGQNFFASAHPIMLNGADATVDNYDSTPGVVSNLWCLLDTRRPLKPLIFQKREEYSFVNSITDPTNEHTFMKNEYLYGAQGRAAAGYGLWQMAYGSINDLNSTNVQAYTQKMMALKGDQGEPLDVKPVKCVCGPSNWAAARALFLVPTLTGGAANPNFGMCEVIVSPYLT